LGGKGTTIMLEPEENSDHPSEAHPDDYPHAQPNPPVFGSSCWGYGLWFAGLVGVKQLGDVLHNIERDDREGAATGVLIPFVLLFLRYIES
jgi:hypothetical protein